MKYNPVIVKNYMRECGLPEPELEYRFHPDRKWRFDFAWPNVKLALEVEGGIYIRKGHATISGIKRDMEKYNAAACLWWRVLRVTPDNLCMQETVDMVKTCMKL